MPPSSAFISTETLAANLWNSHIKIVDASWFMPGTGRDARNEYIKKHLPRAVFFDINEISDRNSPYPHMVPAMELFENEVVSMGISNHDKVVVYDSEGLMSAPRVWWMFRLFGHEKVQILEGGLPKWIAEERQIDSGPVEISATRFAARYNPNLYRTAAEIRQNLETHNEQLLDARSPGRFSGEEKEPRPGLKSGHIPGAKNLYYKNVVDMYGVIRKPEELQQEFITADIDLQKPVICSCGSGITACILAAALYESGRPDAAVYDGSWAEWGALEDAPVER